MKEAKPPSARASILPRVVSLQSVRLIRSQSEFFGIQKGDVLEQLKLEMKVGGRKSPDVATTVQAFVALECAVLPRDHDRVVAKVSCDMALDYLVSDPAAFEALTEDDCVAFASANGVYNAWPYMREFCQSVSLRMILPAPIILPSLPPRMMNAKAIPE